MTDIIYTNSESNVIIESTDGPTTVIESIEVGPPGPPGSSSASSDLSIVAAVALGGHRIVVSDENGKAAYADHTVLAHANKVLGMTTGAIAQNGSVAIRTEGEITEGSWAWTLDVPVWLAANGLLSQESPLTGFSLIVGFPITATKLFIDIREPIFLI